MINIKNFVIKVSCNNEYVEFHTSKLSPIIPKLPFVIGEDRMNTQSNINNIIKHVKNMMLIEGYNQVTCMHNNLAIYAELIMNLKHVEGLVVKKL